MLTGLLLLHPISYRRPSATYWNTFEDLRLLESLCGVDALQNVIVVTTMWDHINEAMGTRRELELEAKFCSPISAGARVVRFEHSYQSAWEIINQLSGVVGPLHTFITRLDELRTESQAKRFRREQEKSVFPNLDALINRPFNTEPTSGNLAMTILALRDAQRVASMYRLPSFKDAVSLGLTLVEFVRVRLGNC